MCCWSWWKVKNGFLSLLPLPSPTVWTAQRNIKVNFIVFQFISMPSKDEADKIASYFYRKTGLPFVQGIIDGTHIEIPKPLGKK